MKKIIAAVLASISLATAPAALAHEGAGQEGISLSGDVSVKFERDTAAGDPSVSGTMTTLKLKAESDLGNGWALFARLGAQSATQPILADFTTSAYAEGRKTVAALDQWGLTYKNDNINYKIGRQEATVGTTALLYSRPETNIGKNAFVDGLSLNGTIGALDLSALLAQEDNPGQQDNRVYAARFGYSSTDKLNWGLTLGRYENKTDGSTNHVALDGTYKFGKAALTAEFTKSNVSTDNKAHAASLSYGFDDKTSVYVTGFRVEVNGDMGRQSDFDNDNKGVYYGLTHKLGEKDSLEIIYKDQRVISSGQKNTKLEATYTYSF